MNFRTIRISDPEIEPKGLIFITAKSASLKGRVDVSVKVPDRIKGGSDIPVVVLLHGVYGSHWAWAYSGNAHNQLEAMISKGTSEPFILAMPSDGLWGDGTGYVPHKFADFEKWVGVELPSLLEQTIDEVSPQSRFYIGGLSMGGYGAFRIGLKYTNRYSGISGHSSMTDIAQMPMFVEEDWSFWNKENDGKIEDILDAMEVVPPIRFDCGSDDELLGYNRELRDHLVSKNVQHVYQEFPGGHEWSYWQEHVSETFKYFTMLYQSE